MTHSDLGEYCELRKIELALKAAHEKDDFVDFIRFCAERLNKGETVQAIWIDYSTRRKNQGGLFCG